MVTLLPDLRLNLLDGPATSLKRYSTAQIELEADDRHLILDAEAGRLDVNRHQFKVGH
ncbi:hypothetical protein VB779_06780 [Haloarculaceae archaeon H-GB11]|nr:hypothetical protein [Haloarculaceae archaeon H-GB11]